LSPRTPLRMDGERTGGRTAPEEYSEKPTPRLTPGEGRAWKGKVPNKGLSGVDVDFQLQEFARQTVDGVQTGPLEKMTREKVREDRFASFPS